MLRFGRYEVLSTCEGTPVELGRGGMGVTYKAYDPSLGNRAVVLKVINALLLGHDPGARARFRREASMAALLHHPHIATVFDIGEERGDDYYVMEYVAGENLLSRLKHEGLFGVDAAVCIAQQVLEALVAAWEQRIVHRDIKPGNLMLAGRPAGHNDLIVKVVDFGLAKALKIATESADAGTIAELTSTSQKLFSPAYASPEQIEDEEIDIRSDLYSLGVTLWHVLAGVPTFGNTSYQKTIVGHLSKPPPIEELQAKSVPEALIAFLVRLLGKTPASRPADPRAALAELAAVTRSGASIHAAVEAANDSLEETRLRIRPRAATTGDVLDGRFRLDALVTERPAGSVFRAADLQAAGALVCLKMLDPRSAMEIGEIVPRLCAAPHPNVLGVSFVNTRPSGTWPFVALEWMEGDTLLTLLRRRRNLTLPDALLIGEQVAVALDHGVAHGLGVFDLKLHNVFVDFSPGMNDQTRARPLYIPLPEWPPFVVKVDPLATLADPDRGGGEHTLVPGGPGQTVDEPVRALAFLMHELLSGGPLMPASTTCAPLPSLDERSNDTLHAALRPGVRRFASAVEFCEALRPEGFRMPMAANASTTATGTPQTAVPADKGKARRIARNVLAAIALTAAMAGMGVFLVRDHQRGVEEKRREINADLKRRADEQQQQIAAKIAADMKLKAATQAAANARKALSDVTEKQRLAALDAEKERVHQAEIGKEAARVLQEKQRQAEIAQKAAVEKARQAMLRIASGDEVIVVREDTLFFQTQPRRMARLGERFRVLQTRPDLGKVFVPEIDANGVVTGALSISAAAVRVMPVDVAAVLRKAGQTAKAGDSTETAKLLAYAAKVAPAEPAIHAMSDAITRLAEARAASVRLQQIAQENKAEILRLLHNAEIAGHPNPLGDDGSRQADAVVLIERAHRLDKDGPKAEDLRAAEQQVQNAAHAVDKVPLPPAPALPISESS